MTRHFAFRTAQAAQDQARQRSLLDSHIEVGKRNKYELKTTHINPSKIESETDHGKLTSAYDSSGKINHFLD